MEAPGRTGPALGHGVLSCATPVFCVATDDGGNASAWNGHGWTRPATVFHAEHSGFQAISCAGGTCEAVMSEGQFVYLYDGSGHRGCRCCVTRWRVPAP